jgi:hypothetical protein
MFIVDRAFNDIFTLKIAGLCTVPFSLEDPTKIDV